MVTEASSTRRRRSPLAAALAALCTTGVLVVAGPAFAGPLVVEPEAPTATHTPAADWYLYHHWTEPSPQGWPPAVLGAPSATTGPSRAAQPAPAATATAHPVTPTPSPAGGSPDPDPTRPPATPAPEATPDPRPEPTRSTRSPRPTRSAAPAAPDPADDRTEAGTQTTPGVPLDPMAAGPQGQGLVEEPWATETPDPRGLDERFPDPVPTASPAVAARLSSTDARLEAAERGRLLVYSGSLGLAVALIGLGVVARRRRTW